MVAREIALFGWERDTPMVAALAALGGVSGARRRSTVGIR